MELNDRLYELRKNNNWSQEELAEKLDVSRQTVSKWESNKAIPELDKLVKLSEIYNITLDELVKGTTTNENPKENSFSRVKVIKEFLRRHLKKILIIISVLILLFITLFFVNIARRISIVTDISKYYKEYFQTIGVTKGGGITEHIVKRDLNNIEEIYKKYLYYVSENGEKLVKIISYEDEYHEKPIEEIYIDLNEENENGLFDNVTKIDLKDRSQEVVNDYEFVSPILRATSSMNNYYSLICAWDKVYSDKEMAFDFDNKLLKFENRYVWNNEQINDSKDNISVGFNEDELFLRFDDYQDDIKEKREIINLQIYNTIIPDREQVIAPEF